MRPIAAATSAEAPPSGISPILVNASMKNAFSEASTTSHADGQRHADAGRRALHDGDHRLGQRDDGAHGPVGRVEHRRRAPLADFAA